MTRHQLDAIRARVEAALTYEPTDNEEEQYCPLCEDGYVNGQRYDAKEALAATIVAYGIGEGLRRAKEWVKNAPTDLLALLAEVERLTAERDAAFQRGVVAMRKEAADLAWLMHGQRKLAQHIRALPDPEDTER